MGSLGGWELLIILVVLVALFGAKRLPDMARSIGQSARVFKGEMKGLREDDKTVEGGREQAPRADVPQDSRPATQPTKQPTAQPVTRPETPGPAAP
jgi:sec-independent protein translocase protein TatA